jgi:type VI secretion system protein ImpG
MVNLYRQRAEPIQLTHQQHEYHVVPDARRPLAHEIYSIERVVATSPTNETLEFAPFYSLQHSQYSRDSGRFWYARRHPAAASADDMDRGTEVELSLVDLDLDPSLPADWTLSVETTCLNRDLPGRLPFGGGEPRLQAETGALTAVTCVTAPTKTYRPVLTRGTLWRLISHLTLNHLSLVDGEDGAEALREILRLYDRVDSEGTHAIIDGLLRVQARRVVGRVGGPVSAGFCRGVEVTLVLDETKFAGAGLFLFAAVLDRFLGLYSSLNSFTRTVVMTNHREQALCRWPARAGEKVLL